MRLASFDIFDTALVRRCGMPGAVFELVALRLWPGDEVRRDEFVNLRRQAEARCGGNATLADIYAVDGMGCFPEYSATEMMQAEMDVESDMLKVNPATRNEINRLRAEGWTIKFISDMYLPSEFLAQVLNREECMAQGDEVIVSCEWKARKDNGSLYKAVRDKFRPSEWRHYGDNRHSDIKMARKNGVKATMVNSRFTPVEQRFVGDSKKHRDSWLSAVMAGASRVARIKSLNDPKAVLAADYVAALYVPFVVWVMRIARRSGVKRLHFLSRDGYIMMKIAEMLGFDDIELNYLFVSRKALMRAYLQHDGAKRFVEVTDRRTLIKQHVDKLLANLQLNRKKLEAKYKIQFVFDKILTPARQQEFLEKIFANPEFTQQWLDECKDDAQLTEEYLRAQGLTDGTPQAMVDIGWLGTTRLMLNGILGTNIPTYYVGVRGDVYGRECGDYASYFPMGALDTAATGLIENYFSASPWPSTVGYCRNASGEVDPRFAAGLKFESNNIIDTNIAACQAIALELKPYLELLDDNRLYCWAKQSIDTLAQIKDAVDLTPLMQNASFDDIPMARKLSPVQLITLAATGARHTAFDRGSVALTVGHGAGRYVWQLHTRTARLRELMYRVMLKIKNR